MFRTAEQQAIFDSINPPAATPAPAPAAPVATPAPTPTPPPVPVATPTPTPTAPATPAAPNTTSAMTSTYSKAAGYTGPSIVDFLSTAGQPSDYNSRSQLATKLGIQNYTGSATQNTQLLNMLKGFATGQVSSTGVPTTMSSPGTVPTPTTPINVGDLGNTNPALGSVLGASVGNSTTTSDINGLLGLYGAQTDASKKVDEVSANLTDAMKELGNEGVDLKAELDKNGTTGAYQQVQELSLQAASLKGELDKFDAETQTGLSNLEDQPIPTGLLTGQKAQYQKQRDLTRLSKASELSSVMAMSQAYLGNAQLGEKLANDAITMKYQPIQNEIDVLKTQLGVASDSLTRDDNNRSKVITALINLKQNDLDTQKANDTKVQGLAIQAAVNGAPTSVVNAIKSSTDPVSAAALGATWIKGNLESTAKNGSTSIITQDQQNKGALNAGVSIADFAKLPTDDENFYVNGYNDFHSSFDDVGSGKNGSTGDKQQDVDNILLNINAEPISSVTKQKLTAEVQKQFPNEVAASTVLNGGAAPASGSLWDTIKGWFQ